MAAWADRLQLHSGLENAGSVYLFDRTNQPPVALCEDVVVPAGAECAAEAAIDGGSYDPDGNDIFLSQEPPGPYGFGVTDVVLTVSDGSLEDTCAATVTVEDVSPPEVFCNAPPSISPPDVPLSFTAAAADNCGAPLVFFNTPHCFKVKGVGREEEANCRVRMDGPSLILLHPGGVGTTVQWLATAVDLAGNGTAKECSVAVVPRGRCLGHENLELVGWSVAWNQSFESCGARIPTPPIVILVHPFTRFGRAPRRLAPRLRAAPCWETDG